MDLWLDMRAAERKGGIYRGMKPLFSLPRGLLAPSYQHSDKWYFFKKDRNTLIECSISNILNRNRPTLSFSYAYSLDNFVLWNYA